jgi:predicted DNA-binding transcriptional regulator YafY
MTDTLTYALASLKRAVEIGYPWSVSPHEARALVAEIEHLRAGIAAANAEAATMRAWAEEAAKAENENAEDAQKECAAVVAWLRDNEDAWHMPTWQLADAIERGEHRREEEP